MSDRKIGAPIFTGQSLKAYALQQAAIAELSQRALMDVDLSSLMNDVVRLVAQTLGVEYCKILELVPGGRVLRLRAGVGWKPGVVGQAVVDAGEKSQAGFTLLSNEPVIVQDLRTEKRFSGPALLTEHGVVSGISLIIPWQERPFGVLGVHTTTQRHFTIDEVYFVQAVANVLAAAIRRKSSEETIRRQIERINALRSIDIAISGKNDLHPTLEVILSQVVTQLRVDVADVLLFNPHTQLLEFAAGHGFRTGALQYTRLQLGAGYAGIAARESRIIGVPDVSTDPGSFAQSQFFGDEGFVSYYAVPLIAKGKVKGVLEIFHRAPLDPDREWINFLEALAGQAAIALDSAEMFDDLQLSNSELILAYDETIEGWSRALDLRDRETEGHTQRVTEMTLRLAREMRMNDAQLVHIRRGAMLHDIGKMGIPDSILLKPSSLTDVEWETMRKHPIYANVLLSSISYLRPALEIPYCHHEKWNGSGYPQHLEGEQIPISARLFAVVDVWDALRSDRPYRVAWSESQVRDYIQAQTGTHFDPQVVDVFLGRVI